MDAGESPETKAKDEPPAKQLIPASSQNQKHESALLVTDSWWLANKGMVVTEILMPPSQESSSDSVFTDPEEVTVATGATKGIAPSKESEPAVLPETFAASKSHEDEPLSTSPLFGKRTLHLISWHSCSRSIYLSQTKEYDFNGDDAFVLKWFSRILKHPVATEQH